MLETTSNFRTSLDLFELANFGMNYGPHTADKAITGCTKVALPYFGPFPAKRRLKIINTLVFFRILSKMREAEKSNGLRSENFGGHCAVEMKRGTYFLSHSWLTHAECGGAEFVDEILVCPGFQYCHIVDNIRHSFWPHGQWIPVGSGDHTITIGGAWVLVANSRCKFKFKSLVSKPDHVVCLQTAQFGMARKKPNSVIGKVTP